MMAQSMMISVMHHINRVDNHVIMSMQKTHLTKFNTLSWFKNKTRNRVNFRNIIKAIHKKPTAIIVLSGEKLKSFPLRSGTR